MTSFKSRSLLAGLLAGAVQFGVLGFAFADTTLLNVSYDPTRELYKDFNAAFAAKWKADTGETVTIQQSHGGSGKQARAVIDGLDADVVTLALESDINAIVENSKKINPDWRTRLPNNSSPYTSTIVFLVRKGNPKGINDWGDLIKDGVAGHHAEPEDLRRRPLELSRRLGLGQRPVRRRRGQDQGIRRQPLRPCAGARHRRARLDRDLRRARASATCCSPGRTRPIWRSTSSAPTSSTSSSRRRRSWPSRRSRWSTPMSTPRARARSPRPISNYLYSAEGQTLAAKHHYRPSKPELVPADELQKLPELKLVTIDDPIFGGWAKAQPYHFGDGGIFDQIYKPAQ